MATDKTSPDPPHNRRLIYGRRQGHRLHAAQARRIAEMLPEFEPELTGRQSRAMVWRAGAGNGFDTFALEIGFGGGEHLAACAKAAPRTGFIGCEPFINGVAKLLGHIEAEGLENLCVHHGDARDVMAAMPANALDQVVSFISRPMAEKRHHKRRFVNQENLDSLFRILAPQCPLAGGNRYCRLCRLDTGRDKTPWRVCLARAVSRRLVAGTGTMAGHAL